MEIRSAKQGRNRILTDTSEQEALLNGFDQSCPALERGPQSVCD